MNIWSEIQAGRSYTNNPTNGLTHINPFSLMKLAYMKCTKEQQDEFDDAATPSIEVAKCCSLLKSGQTIAMRHAIYNGHVECFKHGHINGLEMPFFSCNLAAIKGNLEIMKYSHLFGSHLNREEVCQDSARGGNYDCLVFGHLNGGRMTNEALLHSIRLGCSRSVSYEVENGAIWKEGYCAQTAYSGNLSFVKFCRENGCPWSVTNTWDWFQPASRLSFLQLKVKNEAVEQEMRQIMDCVDYIMATAEILNGCGFRDNPDIYFFRGVFVNNNPGDSLLESLGSRVDVETVF